MPETHQDPPRAALPTVRADSIVLVNGGDGKEKSSAALGVMGRAWARGWRIAVIQFVQGETWLVDDWKIAETAMEMRVINYVYDSGIRAIEGIEY